MKIANIDLKKEIFIIAELSSNHNKSLDIALKSLEAIKKTGASAVKFQTYTANSMSLDYNKKPFIIKQDSIWDGKSFYELYKEASMPYEWYETLFKKANELNLLAFSSVFDFHSVDFISKFNPPAYKIASFEITDIPLIEYLAKKNKVIIISSGVASKEDIRLAIETCKKVGNDKIILLKCTSSYPSKIEDMNLLTIKDMKKEFKCELGLSDHSIGFSSALTSIGLGARVIEKHFILDKDIKSLDNTFSTSYKDFKEFVRLIKEANLTLGKVDYQYNAKNREFARSLFISKDIKKGEAISKNNIKSVRPNFGLEPKYYKYVLGKLTKKDLKFAEPLRLDDLIL